MVINRNEMRVLFDVDGTLVFNPGRSKIDVIKFNYYGKPLFLKIKTETIDLLKAYKRRGYEIEVSSANGWNWALEVVEKLDLVDYVDHISTKYLKYVDDVPADNWMHRIDPTWLEGIPKWDENEDKHK